MFFANEWKAKKCQSCGNLIAKEDAEYHNEEWYHRSCWLEGLLRLNIAIAHYKEVQWDVVSCYS